MVTKAQVLRKFAHATKLSPEHKQHALRTYKTRMRARLSSLEFLDAHPDRGITDKDVVVMHSLKRKADFTFEEVQAVFHLVDHHGMGVLRAIRDRYPKISRTLAKIGARRTKARRIRSQAKPAVAAVAAVAVQVAPEPVQVPTPSPSMDNIGVINA